MWVIFQPNCVNFTHFFYSASIDVRYSKLMYTTICCGPIVFIIIIRLLLNLVFCFKKTPKSCFHKAGVHNKM